METSHRTVDLGNNEVRVIGIFPANPGSSEFRALTLAESKTFKTYAGAAKWLAKRGYKANGMRI